MCHSLVDERNVGRPDVGGLDVYHRQIIELTGVPRESDVVPDLKRVRLINASAYRPTGLYRPNINPKLNPSDPRYRTANDDKL